MAAAGAPLRAIQEWLGHSDYRTTLIYADYALDPHHGARFAEQAFGASRTASPSSIHPFQGEEVEPNLVAVGTDLS